MLAKLPLLACLGSTLFMTGVIWFVQVVHYPLFDRVEAASFRRYHAEHSRATGTVVLVPMVVELASAAWLGFRRPAGSPAWLGWLGLALAVATWAATFLLSVPAHRGLAGGFDPAIHRSLIRTNWLRSAAWTGHSAVVLAMVGRSIG